MEEIEQEVSAEMLAENSVLFAEYANKHLTFMPLMLEMFKELQAIINKYNIQEGELPAAEALFTAFLNLVEDAQAFSDKISGESND